VRTATPSAPRVRSVGRAVVALAGDPDLPSLTGRALEVMALAERYGIDVTS
jgi:hypothetical protein